MKRTGSDDPLQCSFCHKSPDAVGKLISSPSDYPRAYICDECIAACNWILEDDKTEQIPRMNRLYRFYDSIQSGYGEPLTLCDECHKTLPVPDGTVLELWANDSVRPCDKCGRV